YCLTDQQLLALRDVNSDHPHLDKCGQCQFLLTTLRNAQANEGQRMEDFLSAVRTQADKIRATKPKERWFSWPSFVPSTIGGQLLTSAAAAALLVIAFGSVWRTITPKEHNASYPVVVTEQPDEAKATRVLSQIAASSDVLRDGGSTPEAHTY